MCEICRPLRLDTPCPHVGVFINLGLLRGERGTGRSNLDLCVHCRYLLDEMGRWVFENTDVFHVLDREIEKRDLAAFVQELWPNLFYTIVEDEKSLNEGRLFALLTCLTRAGKIWKERAADPKEISNAHRDLERWLKIRLPSYDWGLFHRFLSRMQASEAKSWREYLMTFLNLGIILAFKLLGER